MKKFIILLVSCSALISTGFAATPTSTLSDIQAMLDQYAQQVRLLETENQILRDAVARAGLKIPLTAYSGMILSTSGSLKTSTGVVTPVVSGGSGTVSSTSSSGATVVYSGSYGGFITRIHTDWDKIREAYTLPTTSIIGGYEFVQTGALDNVFVDIVYSGSVGTGAYDAKILYQYTKDTYARKLVGLFEYNKTTGYYRTKTGSNPFSGVARVFVADPAVRFPIIPNTATSIVNISSGSVVPPLATSTGVTNSGVVVVTSVSLSDIENAYAAKRYLTTLSLSETWLASHPATLDVLRIRYRTYFIIGRYTEALTEVEKIRAIGQLSSAVACEGYVIATYAKDITLGDSYKTICNAK